MTCTRPDITFAVGMLSRFTSNPSKEHWNAVQRLMRDLKGTLNYCLLFSGYPSVIEGFSDASWCSDPDEFRSTGGFVYTLGAITIFCDNQAASTVAENKLFNGRKKTLRLKHSYLSDLISRGIIAVIDVRSSDNLLIL
ncbi:secreted RxLR effector protein 161-like [Tasmannia lanceolata]|uniref:secreted RxLR effector protein 161-like n=1 Tax=Tasmannia lanceolata TaxID=3420 RepID=UPI0040638417